MIGDAMPHLDSASSRHRTPPPLGTASSRSLARTDLVPSWCQRGRPMLEAAYHQAAIYFPFSDVMVANPYADIAKGLELAFYIRAVAGDRRRHDRHGRVRRPRRVRADLDRRRRQAAPDGPRDLPKGSAGPPPPGGVLELEGRRERAAGAFTSARAAKAKRMPFAHPDPAPRRRPRPRLHHRNRNEEERHEEMDRRRPRGATDHSAF